MSDRFQAAVSAFDNLNAQDPNSITIAGVERPRELVQAERLSQWVQRLAPEADEVLRLAARCQHLQRWAIPRSSYPEGRIGYLKWRTDLARFHAEKSAAVLREAGYDSETIERVKKLNLKQGLRTDPNMQTLEDALCLSFLEHEFAEFAQHHPEPKLIDILQKTWRKMSERAHGIALELPLSDDVKALVSRALTSGA